MPATATTTIRREWLVKMALFFALLVFFGLYGLYDALHAYPKRGRLASSYLKWQYLQAAEAEWVLGPGAGAENPSEELARLSERERAGTLNAVDRAKLAWLRSLKVLKPFGEIDAADTRIADARADLAALTQQWQSSADGKKASPKPLAVYDIPVQWLFVAIGFGGGLWMLVHFVRVRSRSYSWDEAEKRLTLPDGSSLVPADLEDVDKRRWEKYIVFVKVRPGHRPHGGRELKLDLYQHVPLEAWVLEMEKAAFPDRENPAPATPKETENPAAAPPP